MGPCPGKGGLGRNTACVQEMDYAVVGAADAEEENRVSLVRSVGGFVELVYCTWGGK